MQQPRKLIDMPEFGEGDIFFTLKDVTYTPDRPRLKAPFTVRGKIELFKIPFLAPIWVRAKVTYPEAWWEEIVPIIGAPTVIEGDIAIGSDFEISFPRGFDREGEFVLDVEAYAGPTFSVAEMTIPPFPPVTSYQTTFLVAGEVPEEELGFRNFRILSYSKNGGPPVTPPGVLELEVGDKCRLNLGFDHMNGAVTGKFHAAIWKKTLIDPHDEQLNTDIAFSAPSSADWQPFEASVDIVITSVIKPGAEYGLYAKVMGITGGDIFTEYLENVITIIGPPPEADIADIDFELTKGSYALGTKVPFTMVYKYKGKTQGGQLTISIGTGVTPSFFTRHTYDPVPVNFQEAIDWEERQLEGSITLPDVLEAGQTYSVRARLETLEVKAQETDTDWSAFDILKGPPTADIGPLDRFAVERGTYNLGDRVNFSLPYEYKGKAQGGFLTISLGTGIQPGFFTKHTFPRIPVSFNEAIDWTPGDASGNFILPTTLEEGQTYSVRAKLETADGAQETGTEYGAVSITEGPPASDIKEFGFSVPKDTYDIGDTIHYDLPFQYKGKAQGGRLTILLRHPIVTVLERDVIFEESFDWRGHDESGSFTLPDTLEPGKTYTAEATLRTADGAQEIGTEYGVIKITEVVTKTLEVDITPTEGGYVTTEPKATEGHPEERWYNNDTGKFEYGTRVRVTAHPNTGYEFEKWADEIQGGVSYNNPEWVSDNGYMYDNKAVKAHFREIVVEEYTLAVKVEPSGTGSVTKSPNKTRYAAGEQVTLTAIPYSGYEFNYWSGDASGYSTSVSVYMSSNKSTTAHFKKKLPVVGEIVNFSMRGDGFPFNTKKWVVYYYDPDGVRWSDDIQHSPGDTIRFYGVPTGGYMSCFCWECPIIGECEWKQYWSNPFLAENNGAYKYDIASGKIFIV